MPGIYVRESKPTPQFDQNVARLKRAVADSWKTVAGEILDEGQQEALRLTPVYNPEPRGHVLPPPTRGQNNSPTAEPLTGDAWWRTVVATLSAELEKVGVSIPEPTPGVLRAAVAERWTFVEQGNTISGGFASWQQLNDATKYQFKILIKHAVPSVDQRGDPSGFPAGRAPYLKPQALWWNFSEWRWQSASLLAAASGATFAAFGAGAPMSGSWRGNIEPESGYWADVEFGTDLAQVPAEFIPQHGEPLTLIYASSSGMAVLPISKSGQGVGAHLFLSRAAQFCINELRKPAREQQFRDLVRAEMR